VPRKTATYTLPNLQGKAMRYFLRGYFYGDGCVHGDGGARIYHIVGNTNFCSQLRNFLLDGIVESCKIYPCRNPKYSNVIMKGRQGARFSQYIIFDNKLVLLPRKHIMTSEVVKGSLWRESDLVVLRSNTSLTTISKLTGRSLESCRAKSEKLGIKRRGDILIHSKAA
jgi:hypothetical protein